MSEPVEGRLPAVDLDAVLDAMESPYRAGSRDRRMAYAILWECAPLIERVVLDQAAERIKAERIDGHEVGWWKTEQVLAMLDELRGDDA